LHLKKNGKSCQAQSKVKHKVIIRYVQLVCHPASQPYFSLTPNQYQPPANSNQQYFSLITNQHQPPTTTEMEKLKKITILEAVSQNYSLQLNGENGVDDHLSLIFMITRPLVKT